MKDYTEFFSMSHKRCKYCFNVSSRIGHLKGFPNTFNYADFENLRKQFGITKDGISKYHLEHFIPKSWGHGEVMLGTYIFF